MKLALVAAAIMIGSTLCSKAQVSFTSPYSQNFDSMGTTGTAPPAGWKHLSFNMTTSNTTWSTTIPANGTNSVASIAVTAAATTLSAITTPAANNNNGFNAAASAGAASDRVIATAPSSVTGSGIQLHMTNGTAATINGLTIAFDTVRYTAPAANHLPGYWVFISTDGTTWTNVTPNPTITTVPSTVGVTATTLTASGLSIAPSGVFYLRWIDDNAVESSPDQIIGLNNVVISSAQPSPVVSLTAPSSGASVALPAPVSLSATATDTNGTITKVEFFQGATKIGEDTDNSDSTYQFSWSGMISGAYSLTAKATDNEGATTTSAAVPITVTNPNNIYPSVSITSPAADSIVPASSLTIYASATDTDGVVTKVEFFADTTKIGEDTAAPFFFDWSSIPVGTHSLTAKVTDNDGAVTTSAAISVEAVTFTDVTSIARGASWKYLDNGSDQGTAWKEAAFDDSAWAAAPAVLGFGDTHVVSTLAMGPASPNQYITYYFRRSFTIADASQVLGLKMNLLRDDGAVVYINGVEVARSNMPAGAVNYLTNAPVIISGADETTYFPITLPTGALVTGNNVIAVEIHQRDGTSSDLGFDMDLTTSVIGGNALPTVSITSPAANATYFSGASIPITASAGDSDGSVTKVEFFQGTTKLGEDTSGPSYEYTWANVTSGTYSLTAVATDDFGSTRTSIAVPVTVSAGPSGTLLRGPYLNLNNHNSIVVRWRSSSSVVGRVRYGTSPSSLNQFTDESSAQTNHEVKLTSLTPYTRYYYSVGSASDALTPQSSENTSFTPGAPVPTAADYTFRTSPTPGTAVDTRIWIVGDCGRGTQTQANGRDAYYAFAGSRIPDLNLQMGDNAYNSGTDTEYQTGYFNMYANIFRKMPQWSTLGNHDANNGDTNPASNHPYFDMFTFPTNGECGGVASGTEHYYSFDYGNIHFICLDAQASVTTVDNPATTGVNEDGPMAAWLRLDLASTTRTWIIAFWHHPPYSKGSHDSDTEGQMVNMRVRFNPILENGGVDLLFFGHSHNYERSVLLDGHYDVASTLTATNRKNGGNGSTSGITTGASGTIRRAPAFNAVATTAGTFIPADGAYIKPLTGPRDRFGAVYNTAGSSGLADAGAINHNAMYICYNTVGTVNVDVNGNTLTATYVQSGGSTPDNFTITKQGAADTDGDGVSDEFEIANDMNRYSATDATLDLDYDGLDARSEYLFGLNPGRFDRYPWTTTRNPTTNFMEVSFPTLPQRTYRVYYSENMFNWFPASAVVAGDGSTKIWIDDGTVTGTTPANRPMRFYKVEVVSGP